MTNEIKILLTEIKGEYNSSYQLIKDFKPYSLLLIRYLIESRLCLLLKAKGKTTALYKLYEKFLAYY
ncbi:MAG: hypothetical protein IKJ59_02695 [Clostridia bacterium]|nr:hypothetical protein [Clostridia bacterium]